MILFSYRINNQQTIESTLLNKSTSNITVVKKKKIMNSSLLFICLYLLLVTKSWHEFASKNIDHVYLVVIN